MALQDHARHSKFDSNWYKWVSPSESNPNEHDRTFIGVQSWRLHTFLVSWHVQVCSMLRDWARCRTCLKEGLCSSHWQPPMRRRNKKTWQTDSESLSCNMSKPTGSNQLDPCLDAKKTCFQAVVRIGSPGGLVADYGLAAAQLLRLRSQGPRGPMFFWYGLGMMQSNIIFWGGIFCDIFFV